MQIHEVTLPSEHIGNLAKKAGAGLAQAAQKAGTRLASAGQKATAAVANKNVASGFIQGLTGVDFPRTYEQDPRALEQATRQRARQLAQQWIKQIKSQPKSQFAKDKSSVANADWRQDALKSAGATFGQAPTARSAPGQMPASVASSAQGQRMLQAYGQPRGGIQSIKEAPTEYTTPSGIIVPAGTKTDPTYLETVNFEKWADQQLTTKITGTGQKIDLDAVKKDPAVKTELNKVLPQIQQDPTNMAAVEMYLLIAMKAMQQAANSIKQKQAMGVK